MVVICIGGVILVGFGVVLLLFVAICLHNQAFSEIFEHSIDKWNRRKGKNQNDEKFLCDLMRFHLTVKE